MAVPEGPEQGGAAASALLGAQDGAVDRHGVASMAEAAEQRLDERLVAEEVVPLGVVQVGRDDRRALAMYRSSISLKKMFVCSGLRLR